MEALLELLRKKLNSHKKKKENERAEEDDEEKEEEEAVGSQSMNEGKHGNILGIKRNVVHGIGAMLLVLFVTAVLFNLFDSVESDSQSTVKELATEDDIARTEDKKKDLSYEELIKANREKERQKEKETQAQQPPQTPSPAPTQTATQLPKVTLPSLTPQRQATVTPVPVQQVTVPVQPMAEQQPAPATEKKDGRYSSSISFGGFEKNDDKTDGEKNEQTSTDAGTTQAVDKHTVAVGTIIPVRLLTGVNTDVPGQLMAQVLSDVYSRDGVTVLIPQGSMVYGSYGQGIAKNGRVELKFNTLTFPDGLSWVVGDSLTAIDGEGYNGVKGKVDKHTEAKIGGAAIGSAIAALGSVAAGNTGSGSSNTYSAGQLAMQGALANLINSASQMFQDGANVQPTTTIKPGYEFNLYVSQNISFAR